TKQKLPLAASVFTKRFAHSTYGAKCLACCSKLATHGSPLKIHVTCARHNNTWVWFTRRTYVPKLHLTPKPTKKLPFVTWVRSTLLRTLWMANSIRKNSRKLLKP